MGCIRACILLVFFGEGGHSHRGDGFVPGNASFFFVVLFFIGILILESIAHVLYHSFFGTSLWKNGQYTHHLFLAADGHHLANLPNPNRTPKRCKPRPKSKTASTNTHILDGTPSYATSFWWRPLLATASMAAPTARTNVSLSNWKFSVCHAARRTRCPRLLCGASPAGSLAGGLASPPRLSSPTSGTNS